MTRSYPQWLELRASHPLTSSLGGLVTCYAEALSTSEGGEVVEYHASNIGIAPDQMRRGPVAALVEALRKARKREDSATFVTDKELECFIARDESAYNARIRYPAESHSRPEFPRWVEIMYAVARRAIAFPAFEHVVVARWPGPLTDFTPSPPLARTNHLVTVTDAEVDAAYEDPDVFWAAWDKIEKIGAVKLCTRALEALDNHAWMGRTFESQMAMARAAKPKLTEYTPKPFWDERFAAWWEPGDLNDEKAGQPALAPLGYDEETRAFELTGFITKTPLSQGGSEPRHVLLRELYDWRRVAHMKKDKQGRPIDAVNVIWPEKWMAISERRPLLDCGLKVFYLDKAKQRVSVT